jgi:hypothetical protein
LILAAAVAALGGPARADPVRTLEERVAGLRERTGAQRILTHRDHDDPPDAPASGHVLVRHENALGAALRLVSVEYSLDGEVVYANADVEGDLALAAAFEAFGGRLGPGPHALDATLVVLDRGAGRRREALRVEARASCPFEVTAGNVSTVTVVAVADRTRGAGRAVVRCNVDARPEPE